MDELDNQIREGLLRLTQSDQVFEGVISSIDSERYLVDVKLDGGGDLFDCRLRATAGSNRSIDVLPAIHSAVVLVKINEDEFLVVACDEITEYRITAGQAVHTINDQGHQIANGDESLKMLLSDLVDQVLKVYAPKDVAGLTAIKQRINTLLT